MAELLRQTEGPAPAPVAPQVVDQPDDDGDDQTPFIEVGGPRPTGTVLKFAPPPLRIAAAPVTPRPPADDVFAVRFEPVRASRHSRLGYGPELVAFHDPSHAVSLQYHDLLTAIAGQLPGSQPRVLLFASAGAGAGTTTVVLNLAFTLARHGEARAVVVDANPRHPDVAVRLGLPAAPGLVEVLDRRTPLAWSLQETRLPGVAVLTAGKGNIALEAAGYAPVIERLRQEWDWVVIDGGAWGAGSEPAALAECCDAVYLVARGSGDAAADVRDAILEKSGRLRGCVVTGEPAA
jgi:Mrp family chromosome partitioning ATPase